MKNKDSENSRRRLFLLFLLVYVLTVLWYTVLKRSTDYRAARYELFWSYRRWLAGNTTLGKQILANMAMFGPLGFLLPSAVPLRRGKRLLPVAAAAVLLSLSIEALQLYLVRGLFESDDLMSNLVGALIGCALYTLLERLLKARPFRALTTLIGIVFMVACLGVFLQGRDNTGAEADGTSKSCCIQIDEVYVRDKIMTLTGFAFRYAHPEYRPVLFLRTDEGKKLRLDTDYGAQRPDVNEYFLCKYDYTASGFTASAPVEDREYELIVKWPWSVVLSTGIYVSSAGVRYAPGQSFAAPSGGKDLAAIVENGTLRVCRPDVQCWVYQLGGDLYWIAGPDFNFEEDGTTYIQYQLWTTQTQNLPEKRLKKQHYWDNIGGYFEKYELEGDFGAYRVMKRALPTAYSIKYIATGYCINDVWVWKNYFRPIYALEN